MSANSSHKEQVNGILSKVPLTRQIVTTSYILRHPKNRQILIQIVGTLAALLSSVSLMPQLYSVRSTRNISGLSIWTPLILLVTSLLWFVYHLLTGTYHGAVSGSFNFMASAILVWTIYSIRYLDYEGTDITPSLPA